MSGTRHFSRMNYNVQRGLRELLNERFITKAQWRSILDFFSHRCAFCGIEHSGNNRPQDNPLATARNDIIHKHSYMDRDLRRLEALYMFNETTWRASKKRLPFENLKYLRSQLMKKTTMAKRKEFAALNAVLLQALDPLFTELLVQYRLQLARLKAIS